MKNSETQAALQTYCAFFGLQAGMIFRAAFLLFTLFLIGDSSNAATKHVILIDLSGSARSVFADYRKGVRELLEQTSLQIGDTVIVIGITADSFGHPNILLQDSVQTLVQAEKPKIKDCSRFAKGSFQQRSCMSSNAETKARSEAEWEEKWRRHFTLERQRLLAKWDSSRLLPSSSATDVIGALKYAEQVFGPWNGEKALFVFSDMRHNTRGIDLKYSSLDSKVLNEIKKRKLMPRLEGVSVVVRGVHTEGTDPAYFENLRQFWQRLFRESGASLREFSVQTSNSGLV